MTTRTKNPVARVRTFKMRKSDLAVGRLPFHGQQNQWMVPTEGDASGAGAWLVAMYLKALRDDWRVKFGEASRERGSGALESDGCTIFEVASDNTFPMLGFIVKSMLERYGEAVREGNDEVAHHVKWQAYAFAEHLGRRLVRDCSDYTDDRSYDELLAHVVTALRWKPEPKAEAV